MKLQLKTTEGKAIFDDEWGTISINGDGGTVKGAVATVDTAGAIDKRITATRMLLTGPLALAWRKKKDERELYLLVEGETYSLVAKIDSKQGLEARKFAAAINSASKKLASAEPTNIAPGEVPNWVGKTADVVIREMAVFKLGSPKMVDNRGKPAMVAFGPSKWTVVGQTGTAHSLVFEVKKIG